MPEVIDNLANSCTMKSVRLNKGDLDPQATTTVFCNLYHPWETGAKQINAHIVTQSNTAGNGEIKDNQAEADTTRARAQSAWRLCNERQ
jgi:hypothetical protein